MCVHKWPWITHPEWFIWDSHGPCPGHGDWALKWQLINDPIVLQIKRCWLRCAKQDQTLLTKVIVLVKKQTINNADFVGDLTPTMAIKRNQNQSFHISENFAVKNSHFLLGLRLRLMGGGVTSLRRLGRWHREALLPLRAGNVAENPGKSKWWGPGLIGM